MTVNINGTPYEIKYSFNSFKYMADLDFSSMEDLQSKPFMIFPIMEMLLMGGLNHNPKVRFSIEQVDAYIESYVEDSPINELMEGLFAVLQDSGFFKNLQKNITEKTE